VLHGAADDWTRFKEKAGCLYGKDMFERLLRATQAYSYENGTPTSAKSMHRPETISLLHQSEKWAPDFTGYKNRSRSSGEQAIPVFSNKTKSTEQKSAPTVSNMNFVAPPRSGIVDSAEYQAEPATSKHQAAGTVSRGKSCRPGPIISR
jgi:hypothetical protein